MAARGVGRRSVRHLASAFDDDPEHSAWVATLAFSGQIFCDFAGYSTTAIGVALCLGFAMPDNFRFPTGRPGNVIDFFSRTGLYIVAIKVHRMSTAQAMEFARSVEGIVLVDGARLAGREVLRERRAAAPRARAPAAQQGGADAGGDGVADGRLPVQRAAG